MNNLTIFSSKQIRTVTINSEPYFVGKDVAAALGYDRATKAIQDHVEPEDKDEIPIQDSIGRMQKTPVDSTLSFFPVNFRQQRGSSTG